MIKKWCFIIMVLAISLFVTGCNESRITYNKMICNNCTNNITNNYILNTSTQIYNVSSVTAVLGTASGTLAYVKGYDSISYNVTEVSSDIDVRFNFTGVTDFNQIILRYKTSAAETHTATIELYDFDHATWESYHTVGVSPDYNVITIGSYDAEDHIYNGMVWMRFYSVNIGSLTHLHEFDWVALSSGITLPSTETDPIWIADKPNYMTKIGDSGITGTYSGQYNLDLGTGNITISSGNLLVNTIYQTSTVDINGDIRITGKIFGNNGTAGAVKQGTWINGGGVNLLSYVSTGFETGTDGWGSRSGAGLRRNSSFSFGGNYSVEGYSISSTQLQIFVSLGTYIQNESEQDFTASAMIYIPTSGNISACRMYYRNAGVNWFTGGTIYQSNLTTGYDRWEKITFPFKTTTKTDNDFLVISCNGVTPGSYMFADNIMIQKGTVATGYIPMACNKFTGCTSEYAYGIGTVTPHDKLEVNGNIFTTSKTNFLLFGTNPLINPFVQGGSSNELFLGTSNNPRMTISSSGNIGVGTLNPSNKFDVSFGSEEHFIVRNGSDFGAGYSGIAIDSVNDYAAQRKMLVIAGSPTILTGGNVAIGSTNPLQKLYVSGNANITGTVYYGALQANSPVLETTSDDFVAKCTTSFEGDFVVQYIKKNADTGKYEQVIELVDPNNDNWWHQECWMKNEKFKLLNAIHSGNYQLYVEGSGLSFNTGNMQQGESSMIATELSKPAEDYTIDDIMYDDITKTAYVVASNEI